jgi:superfamily II DNA helicase RecQ
MCFKRTENRLKSVIFYDASDKAFHLEYILNVKSEEKKNKFTDELEMMNSYVSTNECRRTQLMRNSEIKIETQTSEDCCDNCCAKIIVETPLSATRILMKMAN